MGADPKKPLIVVHHTKDDFSRPEASGGKKRVFCEVSSTLRKKLTNEVEIAQNYFKPQFQKYKNIPAVIKVILKEIALAKSHRPLGLIKGAGCEIIGLGDFGEVFVSAYESSLLQLEKLLLYRKSKSGTANISTIEKILPYEASDALNERDYNAIKEYSRKEFHRIKVKLFDHKNDRKNEIIKEIFEKELSEKGFKNTKILEYGKNLKIFSLLFNEIKDVKSIAKYIGTKEVALFPQFKIIQEQAISIRKLQKDEFPKPKSQREYPIVGVVDSGINLNDNFLKPWIVKTHRYIPQGVAHDFSHGSFVGGLIVNAKKMNHDDPKFPYSQAKLIDVAALHSRNIREDELKAILEEVIPKHPEVKVWNLSLGAAFPCDSHVFSDLGVFLDELQDKYDITFVIAAGNYIISPYRGWPPEDLGGSDRISSPADSTRAITVGSIAHTSTSNSRVEEGHPSPFSRRGPGPVFIPKPEVTHYGGNCDATGNYLQSGVISTNGNEELAENIGTSFSAPLVSAVLANMKNILPKSPNLRNLTKALMIHSAAIKMEDISTEDLKYYGFGVPDDVDEILKCMDWHATSIFNLELIPGLEFTKDFPIPKSLRTPDNKTVGEFTITLVYDPPLDSSFGSEYCRRNVEVSLGTYDLDEKDGKRHHHKKIPLNPLDVSELFESKQIEHGFKWSPVKVYKRIIPKGIQGNDWRLKITVSNRSSFTSDKPQKITTIVTIADPKKSAPVYNEFVDETRNIGWITSTLQIKEQIRIRTKE